MVLKTSKGGGEGEEQGGGREGQGGVKAKLLHYELFCSFLLEKRRYRKQMVGVKVP